MSQETFFRSYAANFGSLSAVFSFVTLVIIVVCGTTMPSISLRERDVELARLRAVGFQRATVFGLLILEDTFVATVGGIVGGVLPFFVTRVRPVNISLQSYALLNDLLVATPTLILGILVAIGVGVLVSLWPALRSLRQPILAGLAE